ncbi:UDP-N-acetylglucosamine transferase subunit ALG13-like [Porphyridium purpureum]|uniref:UDP-N-acetylglucosamine transferase subunit ALG13 n=1 Tax=Porphyridium purpureum TaxID=35688 RepID=A0A5J4YS29_PORPP|nr:UDP-N-acetylglucosamine transferase subunit ALG13-like [Porphyridium purpureum]|eukprot:POR7792..scf236_6
MLRALRAFGYTKLRVQYGRGKFVPRACGEDDGLFDEMVDCFRFKPSLTHDMQRAGLIISHAGAGSIFEALRMGKNLIVVINDRLMDNHQAELAEEMQALGHSYAATCSNLLDVIQSSDFGSRTPLSPEQLGVIPSVISEELRHAAARPSQD